jgi:GTP cyclohydrolase I
MTADLPDVAKNQVGQGGAPLDWVGMENISLPVVLSEASQVSYTSGSASVFVNVPSGPLAVKGIHMSRLYQLLNTSSSSALTPGLLRSLLASAIASHQDCGSEKAKITYSFNFLTLRDALVTPDISGWQSYLVSLSAERDDDRKCEQIWLSVDITYSSTCPCSAALSRQVLRDAFTNDHFGMTQVSVNDVALWLDQNGSVATPHSQRSIARVSVPLDMARPDRLGLIDLIDRSEAALSTPVQTLVKRADEQAFARLNGANLMYVEDAVRRLSAALTPHYKEVGVTVRHLESLHAHDAVASIGPAMGGLAP